MTGDGNGGGLVAGSMDFDFVLERVVVEVIYTGGEIVSGCERVYQERERQDDRRAKTRQREEAVVHTKAPLRNGLALELFAVLHAGEAMGTGGGLVVV